MNFLKRLFGGAQGRDAVSPARSMAPSVEPQSRSRSDGASAGYYDTMAKMQEAIARQEFELAARLVRESLSQIPGWVKETCRDYGSFDISSIPALERGGTVLALVGDEEGLAEMTRVIVANPELAPWAELVDQHRKDVGLFAAILAAVQASPGCLQTDVKTLVGEADGSRVAVLISYLEKAGKLARIKAGRTYKLLPAGSPEIPPPLEKRQVSSHRTDHNPPKLREIDISKLAYVPLPRSPLRWEEAQAGHERTKVAEATEPFEIRDAGWQVTSIEKIAAADRPDPAFRQTHLCGAGIVLIDDLGKAGGLGQIAAAVLCYDRSGNQTAKAGLNHDLYRVGVHPLGRGMIAMSRDCVLHSYDDQLNPVIETALAGAPEIVAIRKRFGIQDSELKNHIRCVAQSRDATRYLFTAVDEAWCVGADGIGLWGAKLPVKEGWMRVATASGGFGTSAEVDRALTVMGLALPITPDELKSRYRTLAKQWHPDLNPQDPQAVEKMKTLTAAAEILTGVDAAALPRYAGAAFAREIDRSEFEAGGMKFSVTIGMQVGEIYASDWIYAASFAATSNSIYLAGYSGRIVLVDERGIGLRVYDIGAVPRQIVDTGSYLYLLTDTRLYVLHDDALHAVIDTFDGGDLIVAQNGFGLLEKKRLRWHSPDGKYIGAIMSKDPIRRVYSANRRLIVETRQQRATIEGVPDWWD